AIVRREATTPRLEGEGREEVAGRLGDERRLVPVGLGIGPRRVQGVAGAGGEAAEVIDLPDTVCYREEAIRVGDVPEHLGRQPADRLVVPVRDRHEDARAAVGRRAEQQALLAEAGAPRVIAGAAEELELRAVGPEAVEPLAEPEGLSA